MALRPGDIDGLSVIPVAVAAVSLSRIRHFRAVAKGPGASPLDARKLLIGCRFPSATALAPGTAEVAEWGCPGTW